MPPTYAQSRIRNILKENQGSAAAARQAVMRAALEDPKLMAELVAPHLSGIAAYAISRVERGAEGPEVLEIAAKKAKKGKDSSFGMELLRHVADDHAVVFGQESGHLSGKKGPASQEHIDAINLIARSQAKGKSKEK